MKTPIKVIKRPRVAGVAAVEMAIVLPILLIVFAMPSIVLAFYFRQYTAAQKAAHDAALYLATAPRVEVTTSGPDGNIAALTLARNIVEKEMAGIVPSDVSVAPAIYCIYKIGAGSAIQPCTVMYTRDVNRTLFQFSVSIGFTYINPLTGSDTGYLISPYVPVRYVGD